MKKTLIILTILLSTLILGSCSSVPDQIDPQVTEELFFKNAQEAMDKNQYDRALYYYEVYLVRYPDKHEKTIGAEYERALIYFKKNDYEYSKDLFIQLLDKYETSPFAMSFPERYKILGHKILDKINIKLKIKEKEIVE